MVGSGNSRIWLQAIRRSQTLFIAKPHFTTPVFIHAIDNYHVKTALLVIDAGADINCRRIAENDKDSAFSHPLHRPAMLMRRTGDDAIRLPRPRVLSREFGWIV